MGATPFSASYFNPLFISIHAPAMGATRVPSERLCLGQISIHAPAMGATGLGNIQKVRDGISIHAPAMGATKEKSA